MKAYPGIFYVVLLIRILPKIIKKYKRYKNVLESG